MSDVPTTAPVPTRIAEPTQLSDLVVRILAPNAGIMTGPGTNSYVVGSVSSGSGSVVVIDPGPADPGHVEVIRDVIGNRSVVGIAVTHHHVDHWPAAILLAEQLGRQRDVRVRIYGHGILGAFRPTSVLPHGGILACQSARLRAVHTPGHASDHLCFFLQEENALFSGDTVMGGSTVVIAPPDGSMSQYLQSLEHLKTLGIRRMYPGHGPVIENPAEVLDYYVAHRLEREQQVTDAIRDGHERVADVVSAVYTDVPEVLHPVARFSVLAHLLKLRSEGTIEALDDEGRILVPARAVVPGPYIPQRVGSAEPPRSWMPIAPPDSNPAVPPDVQPGAEPDPDNPELPLEAPPLMDARFRLAE